MMPGLTIDGLKTLDPQALLEKAEEWTGAHILTFDSAIQGGLVLFALLAGFFIRKIVQPRLNSAILKTTLRPRGKQILKNISRLTMQITALLILLVGTQLSAAEFAGSHSVAFAQAVMALLAAWIVIRFALQLIENTALRNLFALTIWTIAALEILGILDETVAALDAVGMNVGDFRFSALTVIKGLLALFLLLYAALAASGFAERRLRRVTSLTPSSRVLIGKIIRIILIVVALLIGVTAAGVDLSLFAVFSGAVGLGVGFGLQKVISNLFSGMLLLMDKSIKPGDIIEMPNGIFGWVEYMGARYTEIVTRDNKSFLIPNETFITQDVVNWSHGDTFIRLEVKFGVDYRHNPHEVKALAEEAALIPERVVKERAPVCHLVAFGESSLDFTLRFWIRDAENGVTNTRGEVMLALWDAFHAYNIQIPFPQRVMHFPDAPPSGVPVKKSSTKKAP
ncbi:MAG: mechanosensitive ion channel [Alphaproteobacteria bacterium]|nr:mechanosensitive ion channel [Alphaproteobacteria bacterium]